MTDEPPGKRSPVVYLDDILAEIEFLKRAVIDVSFEDYIHSGEKRRAVERSLEIISEASRGVPEGDRAKYPEIPWRRIRDLGSVIRHAYFGIMHERLWSIVQDDISTLEAAIREIRSAYDSEC